MARRLLSVLLISLIVVAPAAGDNVIGKKERIDAQIENLHDKIAATQARERALSAEIAVVSSKIRTLEADVGGVSTDLALLEQDLALQREKLAKITELWHLQTAKLEFLKRQHSEAVDRLSDRLIAIYQSGNLTTVDVLVASASFSDLLSRLEYAKELASQDERMAESVGRAKDRMKVAQARTTVTRRQVATITRAVAVRTEQTRAVRNELISQQTVLSNAKGQKQHTLAEVEEERQAYLDEAEALAQVSAQLASRIQASQSSSSVPVPPSGGGLMWPVSGPVTSGFGWRWGRMHVGIDIAVPTGTPVLAAQSGRVIYAGWLGGYGNLVVLDHGGGLATAYGHNSSIAAGNGQSVSQGQVIAYAGSTGNSTGPHVHFEVRVNGSPVDPLGYLG